MAGASAGGMVAAITCCALATGIEPVRDPLRHRSENLAADPEDQTALQESVVRCLGREHRHSTPSDGARPRGRESVRHRRARQQRARADLPQRPALDRRETPGRPALHRRSTAAAISIGMGFHSSRRPIRISASGLPIIPLCGAAGEPVPLPPPTSGDVDRDALRKASTARLEAVVPRLIADLPNGLLRLLMRIIWHGMAGRPAQQDRRRDHGQDRRVDHDPRSLSGLRPARSAARADGSSIGAEHTGPSQI